MIYNKIKIGDYLKITKYNVEGEDDIPIAYCDTILVTKIDNGIIGTIIQSLSTTKLNAQKFIDEEVFTDTKIFNFELFTKEENPEYWL